jgi:hypothetical protein
MMKTKSARRAVETLAIVLFIVFILACRCKSDLLNTGKDSRADNSTPYSTPYPTPADIYSTPVPLTDNRNSISTQSTLLLPGSYSGSGLNTTFNQRGDFLIRIDSVDTKGGVKGFFEASNGLYGTAALTGGVDNSGKIGLFGKTTDNQGLIISGSVSGDTIRGTYVIGNKEKGMQKGEFTVTRR